ncbi:MAG: hypothetical protein NZM25_07460 [Leptospiraceae bacterium]|nr:hypothetical protein [Leptospiraceae bacterium]
MYIERVIRKKYASTAEASEEPGDTAQYYKILCWDAGGKDLCFAQSFIA